MLIDASVEWMAANDPDSSLSWNEGRNGDRGGDGGGGANGDGGDNENGGGNGGDGVSEGASDPIELFFDLVFVFAFTRVTVFLSYNLTWTGVVRGVALFAVLWWAWVTYSWLMGTIPAESEPAERVVMLAATAIMFVVALAVRNAFDETALLFGVAYFAVRALHVLLSVLTADFETRERFLRLVPGFLGGPALLVVAGFVDGPLQAALWVVGIAIDYGVLFVRGVAKFDVRVEHFVERYRDIVIIALGESILAMGFGIAGDELGLSPRVVLAALLGVVLLAALEWLYFDYVTLAAEEYFVDVEGYERGVVARNSYAYLHLPIVLGIVFVALGLEETVVHVGEPLDVVSTVALHGGGALYLLGHSAFRLYEIGSVSAPRLVVAAVACLLVPVSVRLPSLVALAVLTLLFVVLAAFETAYSSVRRYVHGA